MTDGSRQPQNPSVTSADVQLELRPPLWARVRVVAFPILMAFGSLSGAVPLRGDPGPAVRLFFCLFAAALGLAAVPARGDRHARRPPGGPEPLA